GGQAVKTPFRLWRRPVPEPATALLLPNHDAAALAGLCVRLGLDPLPPVFFVADGFLLKLPRPRTEPLGGVLRLRALAEYLFLPVDADLAPALLPDEAADLVKRRGLVFLPGGRVLAFDPGRPLPLAKVITGVPRRGAWQALPEPAPLAER